MTALLQGDNLDVYRQIVEAAVLAPSAENTQPWRFVVDGDVLTVCLDMTRTLASDIDQMLSLTAIGACIENGVMAATKSGLSANVEIVVESISVGSSKTLLPIAKIRLSEKAPRDPLADCIESRCTSRRMDRRLVEKPLLHALQNSCQVLPNATIHWVDGRRIEEFATLIGIGNRIRFEYEPFHKELYKNLRFTAIEATTTRDGLDVATLQVPSTLARLLSALRTWRRMKLANKLGFSRIVAKQTAQEVRHSGAVAFLTVPAPLAQSFVEGGRALERIWLTATSLGLCFHPTASLPVFLAYARTGGKQLLPQHQLLASEISERFYCMYPSMKSQTVLIAFRIGYGFDPPKVRSLRRNVDEVLQFE